MHPKSLSDLVRASELALLLDLDGTLIPFAATPEDAIIDDQLVALLDELQRSGIHVSIVSGRTRASLDSSCVRLPLIEWIAEHGSSRRHGESWIAPPVAPELRELAALLGPFEGVAGVRFETKSISFCMHWRSVPLALKEQLIAGAELVCDEWLESHPDFERLEGVEMLEVRHRSANKGLAVRWVREQRPNARLIAIGDDVTDDDLFAALGGNDLAISVGRSSTRCHTRVADPVAVRAFLAWVLATRTRGIDHDFAGFELNEFPRIRSKARLLVVSNRIPPTITGRHRSVGGLVSALEPALATYDGVWLGWNGLESAGERPLVIDDSCRPVRASFELAPTWRERYYGGFCNRALWPLLHSFTDRVRYRNEDWDAYVAANREFASHARELVAADGTVWMHDYHLLLAGRELRELGFRGPLGLFLHIPFPPPDLFDTLPWADEILDAMHAFDLLGFHTEQWAQNFRDCARARSIERRTPEIGVLPIGVDPLTFNLENDTIDREIAGLRAVLGDRRLVLGVDRLDYAKGIPERLLAFERLLERFPEWRGRVVFVQISVPSREEVPEYADLRTRVEHLVGRINGHYGEADWVPVRYLYRSYDHRVLAQLYRSAAVALVTPLRDGMNLVAKEFVAAQDPEEPGVLILSKFAGAAAELTDAVITNPYHPDGLAEDLDRALRMDLDERRRRNGLLSATIADKTPQRWAAVFLDRLLGARRSLA